MAGVLLASSIAKLASPGTSRAALATFGITGAGRQRAAWAALIATETALGLGVALIACAGLSVAVLALAREVGMLRLRLGPDSALEIPEEGPELGARSPLIDAIARGPDAELALAVFVSEGCRVCQALEPA